MAEVGIELERGGRPLDINRNTPATAEGALRIDAGPKTVFASVLAHVKAQAERRAAPA